MTFTHKSKRCGYGIGSCLHVFLDSKKIKNKKINNVLAAPGREKGNLL